LTLRRDHAKRQGEYAKRKRNEAVAEVYLPYRISEHAKRKVKGREWEGIPNYVRR